MKKNLECPYCDGQATLCRESRILSYRKEEFKVMAHFYKCNKCEEEFTTTDADEISLTQAYNQYREKNNIPFPEEIIAIRESYQLSASKMSEVLGFGPNGYGNYEKGEIPTTAYGNLIYASADPYFFRGLLENVKNSFTESVYRRTIEIVNQLSEFKNEQKNLCKTLNIYDEPNSYTGFTIPSPLKIANLVTGFIQRCKKDYNDKLKLNKLLFYTDFSHYKNYGKSVSGLCYRAIKYGPVPANYDNIFAYLESQNQVSPQFLETGKGMVREIFDAESDFNKSIFSNEELQTFEKVIDSFKNTTTWDIVEISHREKAWKQLETTKSLINYQEHAFALTEI